MIILYSRKSGFCPEYQSHSRSLYPVSAIEMSVPSGVSNPGAAANYSNLESIFGPMLIGTVLSTAFYGITCVQTYDYFVIPNGDPRWQKFIIVLLLLLDTFDTVLNMHVLYYYLVKNFTNSDVLLSPPWSGSCRPLVLGLSIFVIRSMFALRVYTVGGKNVILCLWIMATSSANFVVGILIVLKLLIPDSYVLPSLSHLLYMSFSLGTASDASIACALYWLFHSMKTGFRRTNSLVKTLSLYTVTNCLLVVTDSTLGFILYIAKPETLIYLPFFMLLGKFYVNAFIASLNAREKLGKNQTDVVFSLSRISNHRMGQNRDTIVTTYDKPTFHHSDNAMSISVQTSVERRTDDLEIMNSSSADAV